MEPAGEGSKRFIEPGGTGALVLALAPIALAIGVGVWLMLGGPLAVVLGAITLLPAFLLLGARHILRTRRCRSVWTLDESGFTIAPLCPARFSRKPLRFDWVQVGAVQRRRQWGADRVLLFLHEESPSQVVLPAPVPRSISSDAEFQRLIREHVEPVRIEAGDFAFSPGRRWPHIAVYVLFLLLAAGMVTIAPVSEDTWAGREETLVFVTLIAPCYAALAALAVMAWKGLSPGAALRWGGVAGLTLLASLSVSGVAMRAPVEWLPASAGALAGFLLGIGVAHAVPRVPSGARTAAAYALCLAGFCAGWFGLRGIPARELEGLPALGAPWTPDGDGFALNGGRASWPSLTEVIWYSPDGAKVRAVPLPVYGANFFVGQEGVLAETYSRESQIIAVCFMPRNGGPPVNVARDVSDLQCSRSPDGRLGIVFWRDRASGSSHVRKVDMATGQSLTWPITGQTPRSWVGSCIRDDGRYVGIQREPPPRTDVYPDTSPFFLNIVTADDNGAPRRILEHFGPVAAWLITPDNTAVAVTLAAPTTDVPSGYARIDLSDQQPAIVGITKGEYDSYSAPVPSNARFSVEKEDRFPHRVFITDTRTGRRARLRGLQPNAFPPMWQPGGNRLLLFYMRYECRFSDKQWWHCLDLSSGDHLWYRPGTLLIDLDSPAAKRQFGD